MAAPVFRDWITLNRSRKFPLRDDTSPSGLPDDFLLDAMIAIPRGFSGGVYVATAHRSSSLMSIQFADAQSGFVFAWVTTSTRQATFATRLDGILPVAGVVCLGRGEEFSTHLSVAEGRLLPRCVTPAAGYSGLSVREDTYTGVITLVNGASVEVSRESAEILRIDCTAGPAQLRQLAGPCAQSPRANNCAQGVAITQIGQATPDCEGNITIRVNGVGVDQQTPVTVTQIAGGELIEVQGFSEDICDQRPPVPTGIPQDPNDPNTDACRETGTIDPSVGTNGCAITLTGDTIAIAGGSAYVGTVVVEVGFANTAYNAAVVTITDAENTVVATGTVSAELVYTTQFSRDIAGTYRVRVNVDNALCGQKTFEYRVVEPSISPSGPPPAGWVWDGTCGSLDLPTSYRQAASDVLSGTIRDTFSVASGSATCGPQITGLVTKILRAGITPLPQTAPLVREDPRILQKLPGTDTASGTGWCLASKASYSAKYPLDRTAAVSSAEFTTYFRFFTSTPPAVNSRVFCEFIGGASKFTAAIVVNANGDGTLSCQQGYSAFNPDGFVTIPGFRNASAGTMYRLSLTVDFILLRMVATLVPINLSTGANAGPAVATPHIPVESPQDPLCANFGSTGSNVTLVEVHGVAIAATGGSP